MPCPGLAIGQTPGWRSLTPPLGKPRNSKSPDIPAAYHSQTASPDRVADTDTVLNDIRRRCGFVHTSLSASARLVTVGPKAAEATYLRPRGRGENREVLSSTASVNGVAGVRLNDLPNVSELSQVTSNLTEPKTLTRSIQKARSRLSYADLQLTIIMNV